MHQGQDLLGHHFDFVVRTRNHRKTTEPLRPVSPCAFMLISPRAGNARVGPVCGRLVGHTGLPGPRRQGRIEQVSKRRRGLNLVFDRSCREAVDVLIEKLLGETKGRMLIE